MTMLALTVEKGAEGRVRAILFEWAGRPGRVFDVVEASDFRMAVCCCLQGHEHHVIGILTKEGQLDVPDEITAAEAAEAYFLWEVTQT